MLADRIRKQLNTEWTVLPPEGPQQLQTFKKTAKQFFITFACCPGGLSTSLCDSHVYLRFIVVYLGSKLSYVSGKEFFI